jgi:hypothetical protein
MEENADVLSALPELAPVANRLQWNAGNAEIGS